MATTTDFITSTAQRRSSYFSGCMSPSCVPVEEQYTRIKSGRRGADRQRRRWRKLMNKMVEESKRSIYGSSKPLEFRYDALSYAQNFDDGNHRDELYLYERQCSQVLPECS
ncbi:hypothetical protein Ccrd_005568 [Cynara cardunculus var. scolymus]|uniref:Uncharacterized protein n=1 Tax=Cynara cardunculus var. scolymus TaxID=59895 RepID=A0A118JUP0_CYNCS|nr:hypothetical protein Ccrd_005568 [Cynara cardunculus var. scolymus]